MIIKATIVGGCNSILLQNVELGSEELFMTGVPKFLPPIIGSYDSK